VSGAVSLTGGGPLVRHVPLPFLRGMTEVTVHDARLTIEALPNAVRRPVTTAMVIDPPPRPGVLIDLREESRLIGFELAEDHVWDASVSQHIVLHAATFNGTAYDIGEPLFANPPRAIPPLPGGMAADEKRRNLSFPALTGMAWFIEITNASHFEVTHLIVEELPHDVIVALPDGNGRRDVWAHGGVLLPRMGVQDVDIRDEAERVLRAHLPSSGAVSLPVEIASATPALVSIQSPPIDATYVARPHGEALRVALRGEWERLPIALPGGLRPVSATMRVTAKHRGRDLNAASHTFGPALPASGLSVDRARSVAGCASFVPRPGGVAGSVLGLAAVRLFVVAIEDAELAIELRGDAAHVPGEQLVKPSVRTVAAGWSGWLELELPAPLAIATGPAAVWIVLRATSGHLLWGCDATDERSRAMVSADGARWAHPDTLLGNAVAPRMQLDHAVVMPKSVEVELRAGQAFGAKWSLLRVANTPELTATVSLPENVLSMLALKPELALRAKSALDIAVDEIELSYDTAKS